MGGRGRAAGAAQIAELRRMQVGRDLRNIRLAALAIGSVTTALLVGLQWSESAAQAAIGVPLMTLVATIALVVSYVSVRRRSPGIPHDRVTLFWAAGCWAAHLAVVLRHLRGG